MRVRFPFFEMFLQGREEEQGQDEPGDGVAGSGEDGAPAGLGARAGQGKGCQPQDVVKEIQTPRRAPEADNANVGDQAY